MAIWAILFRQFKFFSDKDLRRELAGPLDFIPPPAPPPTQWWRRRRVCLDPYCRHWHCARADLEAVGEWYAPDRLTKDAVFDPTLRYPMTAEYLEMLFPFSKDDPYQVAVAHPGRPWPEGNLAKPTYQQARRFVLSHPEVIKFLWRRKNAQLGKDFANPAIERDIAGNCTLAPDNTRYQSWLGARLEIKVYQLAALVNEINNGIYTIARALDKGMEGFPMCHCRACINPRHLAWENKNKKYIRGDAFHPCIGSLVFVDGSGRRTARAKQVMCRCGTSSKYRCITIMQVRDYTSGCSVIPPK